MSNLSVKQFVKLNFGATGTSTTITCAAITAGSTVVIGVIHTQGTLMGTAPTPTGPAGFTHEPQQYINSSAVGVSVDVFWELNDPGGETSFTVTGCVSSVERHIYLIEVAGPPSSNARDAIAGTHSTTAGETTINQATGVLASADEIVMAFFAMKQNNAIALSCSGSTSTLGGTQNLNSGNGASAGSWVIVSSTASETMQGVETIAVLSAEVVLSFKDGTGSGPTITVLELGRRTHPTLPTFGITHSRN